MSTLELITTDYFKDKTIGEGLSKNIYIRKSPKHKWTCAHICRDDNRTFAFHLYHELKNLPDEWLLGYCVEGYDGTYPKHSNLPITRIYKQDDDIIEALGRFVTTGIVGINPKIMGAFIELTILE